MADSVSLWTFRSSALTIAGTPSVLTSSLGFAETYITQDTSADTSTQTTAQSPYDPQKLAFMVETRQLPHLPAQFIHMASIIPPEWNLLFMGSPESIQFMLARPAIKNLETSGRLRFMEIPPEYSVNSRENISRMFTDPRLYDTILAPAEHLLVFQPDAILCTNSDQSLNDYLEWDWVGAPWGKTIQFGGNGGLSLRRVSRILKAIEKAGRRPHNDGALEDLWLVNKMHELDGWHMPNADISKHFSVESVWDDRPLGYHIGWLGVHHEQIWDEKWQVDHIMEYCPEVKIVLGMNLTGDKPEGVP